MAGTGTGTGTAAGGGAATGTASWRLPRLNAGAAPHSAYGSPTVMVTAESFSYQIIRTVKTIHRPEPGADRVWAAATLLQQRGILAKRLPWRGAGVHRVAPQV